MTLQEGGEYMDVRNYCEGVTHELTGWKAKIYDTVRRIDRMDSGDKERLLPQINELHIILEEIQDRIERLERECPAQWDPDRIELEGRLTRLKTIWETTADVVPVR